MPSFTSLALLAACAMSAAAQTWSSCNPMNETDCTPNTALGMNYTWDLTSREFDTDSWNITAGTLTYGDDGAEFIIAKELESPTIQSNFYIFWGVLEVHVKAATGQGIVSSMVLQSDDLDEIDWEFVGADTTHAQTNYYGKGNTTSYDRAKYQNVTGVMDDFHNYTTHWTSDKIEWYVDSVLQRTLNYADAVGGKNFPQTPMNVRLGIWPGGDPSNSNGTIEWAGGAVDYDDAPFTMTIKSVRVTDFSSGKQYKYGDQTGDYTSIEVVNGTSSIAQSLTDADLTTTEAATKKWTGLSSNAKIAIACSVSGFLAISIGVLAVCCVKQRRAGRNEYNNMTKEFDDQQAQQAVAQREWQQTRGYSYR